MNELVDCLGTVSLGSSAQQGAKEAALVSELAAVFRDTAAQEAAADAEIKRLTAALAVEEDALEALHRTAQEQDAMEGSLSARRKTCGKLRATVASVRGESLPGREPLLERQARPPASFQALPVWILIGQLFAPGWRVCPLVVGPCVGDSADQASWNAP